MSTDELSLDGVLLPQTPTGDFCDLSIPDCVSVPDTLDTACEILDGVGGVMSAGHWGTAAIVWAYTEPETHGGDRRSESFNDEKSSLKNIAEFAALKIRGLSTRDSVRKYRRAWQYAVDEGWAEPAAPGKRMQIPIPRVTMMKSIHEPPPLICPFTVAVDQNESAPYHFTGIRSDKADDADQRPWIVNTVTKPLWSMHRFPVEIGGVVYQKGLADYGICGMEESIAVERKSKNDLYATFGQRRHEFAAEIARLHETCHIAHVVIEASRRELLTDPPPSSLLNPKVVNRTIISWSDRWPKVHWHLCSSRREAELETFHRLFIHWKHVQESRHLN